MAFKKLIDMSPQTIEDPHYKRLIKNKCINGLRSVVLLNYGSLKMKSKNDWF